ncbi:DUF2202 domain-containing protein [Microbacterium sp.]|uniref:DUF2202 domain-containing protein n=1 Tax=Microbacterium sp. TaxID=51671 RepID=UPI0009260BBA|nr:DUF2202 domain-containing protein [Microbacterium sp.]MBN9187809.1 DUF2202 domain-containing protein [Microbacterium sp.]MBN9193851.1 DUF2202 domain-containing protein [Microbacterium sp.]OJU70077.1 MAG: hypothetical protein BGO04_05150 [Microbacterium sp. 70-38]
MRTATTTFAAMLGIVLITMVTGCSGGGQGGAGASPGASPSASAPVSAAPAPMDEAARLQYLIEEEKLAHDVYQRFAQIWGERIFDNIMASEVTHQQLLVPVLTSKGIADPRSSTAGVFSDPDIQRLYDQLVRQGSASVTEAYKAGVAIEQKDIADLSADLKTTTDAVTTTVLQRLLAGSQSHLQAFEAHLD